MRKGYTIKFDREALFENHMRFMDEQAKKIDSTLKSTNSRLDSIDRRLEVK